MSRDDVVAWDYNHQAYCRQIPEWLQWLPGGTRDSWTASDEDETNGLPEIMKPEPNQNDVDQDATNKLRACLQNFLTCIAVNCPQGFMETVMRESTSYKWVVNKIKATYNLNTRGENFLEGNNLNFEFNKDFTYQQGWMQVKDFYSSAMLPAGSKFMGKVLDKKETLSPLAYMFIVEKWLTKIHPDLPDYVMKNESHLFTADRPSLACNQQLLCDKMDSMLQKIENKDDVSTNNVTINNVRARGGGSAGTRSFRGGRYRQTSFRGRTNQQGFSPRPDKQDCYICLEAGRTDAALFHTARDCRWRFQPRSSRAPHQQTRTNQNFKVLLVQAPQQGGSSPVNNCMDQFGEITVSGQPSNKLDSKGNEDTGYEDLYRGEDYNESNEDQFHYGGATLEEL